MLAPPDEVGGAAVVGWLLSGGVGAGEDAGADEASGGEDWLVIGCIGATREAFAASVGAAAAAGWPVPIPVPVAAPVGEAVDGAELEDGLDALAVDGDAPDELRPDGEPDVLIGPLSEEPAGLLEPGLLGPLTGVDGAE